MFDEAAFTGMPDVTKSGQDSRPESEGLTPFSPITSRSHSNPECPYSLADELLDELRSAQSEIRALRAEVSSLDRRLAAMEGSQIFRLLRLVGGGGSTVIRKARQFFGHSRLHRMPRFSLGASHQANEYQKWLAVHRSTDPFVCLPQPLLASGPKFSIVLQASMIRPEWLAKTVESIQAQNYQRWDLCVCLDAEAPPETRDWLESLAGHDCRVRTEGSPQNSASDALNRAIRVTDGEYLVLLGQCRLLEPTAFAHYAMFLGMNDVDLAYSDGGSVDRDGHPVRPLFKPAYSPDLLLHCMYLGELLIVSRRAFKTVGGFRPEFEGAHDFDLVHRLVEAGARVGHVSRVLYHQNEDLNPAGSAPSSKPAANAAAKRVLESVAQRAGTSVSISDGPLPWTYRYATMPDPSVEPTIIIPSRSRRLLQSCLSSVADRTAGLPFRIIVAHHRAGPDDREIISLIEQYKVDSVDYTGAFNFSAICNLAAARARSSILVFLNDDVTPLKADWLASLVSTLSRDDVGVAGAQMFYPNGTIQHAGIALGLCDGAGHPGRNLSDSAFWPWINYTRNVSAVSGACFAVRRPVFEQLHGFDIVFPVNYNDVDFCLRAGEAGYRIVIDSSARMTHIEAGSRKAGTSSRERLEFFRRWGDLVEAGDPFYSPNLRPDSEDLRLLFS